MKIYEGVEVLIQRILYGLFSFTLRPLYSGNRLRYPHDGETVLATEMISELLRTETYHPSAGN
jgi:hypothetical protein